MRFAARWVLALATFGFLTPAVGQLTYAQSAPQLGSLILNGVSAFAEVASTPDLDIRGDWTVETWFKDEDPAGFNHDFRQILMKGDESLSPDAPYFLLVGRNSMLAGVRVAGQDFPIAWDLVEAGLDPSAWHHVAVTFRADLNALNLWLDGQHIRYLQVPAHAVLGNNLPLQIGRNGPVTGKYWLGQLHDMRLWSMARKGTDISANYLTELTGAVPGLVANWKFDQTVADTTADGLGGHTANLLGGATFAPIPILCGPGRPACPNLTVTHESQQTLIDAAPESQLSLKVVVRNQQTRSGIARIPAGTRLLTETMPVIQSAAVDPTSEALWERRGNGSFTVTVQPAAETVNTVRYVGYVAPPGYVCTAPAADHETVAVSCMTTLPDFLRPGDSRTFQFTLMPFDLAHPYLSIPDSQIGGTQAITLPISALAQVNPDASVAETDSTDNQSAAAATVRAPFIQFPDRRSTDCPLHGKFPSEQRLDSNGQVITVGTWPCAITLSTAQSSLAAHLQTGALKMLVGASGGAAAIDGRPVTVTLACTTSVIPVNDVTGTLTCVTDNIGEFHANCSSVSPLAIPANRSVQCQLQVIAQISGHIDVGPSDFAFGFGCIPLFLHCGDSGLDVSPLSIFLDPEIIRFASEHTPVKSSLSIGGGSVDF
jgi:hypothetical protein